VTPLGPFSLLPGRQNRLARFVRQKQRDRRRESEPEREEAEILAAKGHPSPLARNEAEQFLTALALATAPPWTKSPA
jgi:hypothetical protein